MENNTIAVVNMRSFFNREIFMHAIGDLRFKQPIALKQALYTVIFLLMWSLPIILIFEFRLELWFFVIAFVPPVVLGRFANKRIWGGRTLIDFFKVTFAYIGEPKGWTDHRANNELGKAVYHVDHEIWVSRRRELQLLADLKEEIKTGQKPRLYIVNNGVNERPSTNYNNTTQKRKPRKRQPRAIEEQKRYALENRNNHRQKIRA